MLVDPKEEYLHLIGLLIEEYKSLQRINPEHPLLELIELRNTRGFVKTDKFFERYHIGSTGNFDPVMGPHADYWIDLRHAQGKDGGIALDKIFGIKRNHKESQVVQ